MGSFTKRVPRASNNLYVYILLYTARRLQPLFLPRSIDYFIIQAGQRKGITTFKLHMVINNVHLRTCRTANTPHTYKYYIYIYIYIYIIAKCPWGNIIQLVVGGVAAVYSINNLF